MVVNPIIPRRGVNDPHIHIFENTAYLYASHDAANGNSAFTMADWQVWSSPDLVDWTHCSTLTPADTYLGRQDAFDAAWATDAAEKDGRYYWYISEGDRQIGVVTGDTPHGPWHDPLGRPLIAEGDVPTHAYDPGIYAEDDERYIVFGRWNYHLARLGHDMTSLAEPPRPLEVRNPQGPYSFATGTPHDGQSTDDKPFLHRRGDLYYLSWGVYYATSTSLYGPYDYAGCIFDDTSFPDGLDQPTWPAGPTQGRHGSFFSWHGQDYFAYCDMSDSGNRFFRDTFISYVHYRADGTIAPVRVDRTGVGSSVAGPRPLQMQDYSQIDGAEKREHDDAHDGFVVTATSDHARVRFPRVTGLTEGSQPTLQVIAHAGTEGTIELRTSVASTPPQRFRFDTAGRHELPLTLNGVAATVDLEISWTVETGSLALDTIRFRG